MNINQKLGDAVQKKISLKDYSTFKLGGPAEYFFVAHGPEEIIKAIRAARECCLPFLVLGGGSNILVSDNGFAGLVIKVESKDTLKIDGQIIKAESGVLLGQIVSFALDNGLSGMEWAVGIPGTIGGAIYGNCGAFGKCAGDNINQVEVLKIEAGGNSKVVSMSKEECQFDYRESIFKKNKELIILTTEFKLKKGDKEAIKQQMAENLAGRPKTQLKYPSVGCVFKNVVVSDEIRKKIIEIDPEKGESKIKGNKVGAGWFIDKAGLKGHQIGGARVSDDHGNYIVKYTEECTAADVVMLISYVKQQIRDKFKIQLQEELNYVGY